MDGLKQSEANLVVYVHPSKSMNVKDAVYHELSSMLFKFDEALDGVVLSYKTKFDSKLAKILPGIHPYFGVRFQAQLLLFSPKLNMLLEGEVVKVCPQSIHIIVLGFSSAIISDDDMHGKFKYKIKHREEVFVSKSHKRHKIKVGTIVRFSVKRLKKVHNVTFLQHASFDEEILHICGSLNLAGTGSVAWLEQNTAEMIDRGSERPVEQVQTDNGRMMGDEETNAHRHMKKVKR